MEQKELKKGNIKKTIIKIILFICLIVILFYIYIFKIEVNLFKVSEIAIVDEQLKEKYNGFKIAHFSDIHFGRTIMNNNLEKIVTKINDLNSDVVIFTGDLLDDFIKLSDDDINTLKENLKNIQAKYRKYAVLGDNDYLNKELFLDIMQGSNFQVLDNDIDLLYIKDSSPLEFIGISSSLEKQDNLDLALSKTSNNDYFKILLAHEPSIFDNLENYDINLVFSGHSLGGLAHLKNKYLLKQDGINNYYMGKYTKDNSQMYVNPGLGTYKYNLRFNNPPTINFYRLYNN